MSNATYTTLKQAQQIANIGNEARQNAGKYGKMPPLRDIKVVVHGEDSGFKVVTLGFANANELQIVN